MRVHGLLKGYRLCRLMHRLTENIRLGVIDFASIFSANSVVSKVQSLVTDTQTDEKKSQTLPINIFCFLK